MAVLIPNDKPWRGDQVTVSAPDYWLGSSGLAAKLGRPVGLPEGLRAEWLDVYEGFNGLCGLRVKVLHGSRRADIELYGAADLPTVIDGAAVTAGYAAYEDGREMPVLELRVAEREQEYRLAIEAHEGLHSLKLKHAPAFARSLMIAGLKRTGEGFYRTEPGEDDVWNLRRLYGRTWTRS